MDWDKNANIIKAMNLIKFTVNEGAYVHLGRDWKQKNVCSPYSRLYFVMGGDGIITVGATEIPLTAGNVYLIPAGLTFSYRCERTVEKFYAHINAFGPDGYDMMLNLKTVTSLPFSIDKTSELNDLYNSNTIYSAMQLKGKLQAVFLKFQEKYRFGTEDFVPYSKMVADVMDYVKENLSAKLDIKYISKKLYISENTLSKKFKAEVGKPLGQYIDDLLFFESQRLLLYSDRTIGQVSESLGFCDQFYFSRRFKQKLGETPSNYRKKVGTI